MARGSVINEALGYFLYSASQKNLEMCRKRKVDKLIDWEKFGKLNEYTRTHGVNRTDLIRFAIRKVIPMFAKRRNRRYFLVSSVPHSRVGIKNFRESSGCESQLVENNT